MTARPDEPAGHGAAAASPRGASSTDPSPLRTLHVNTERTWRGGERQTFLLATGLRDRGHRAIVACPPGAPLGLRARAAGLEVVEMPMRGELDLRAIRRLRRIYRDAAIDVVQLHTSHAHTLGTLARVGRSLPRTVVARRVDYSIFRSGTPGFTRLKYRFGVDRYIAISAAIRDVLVGDGIPSERISVVHSGIVPLPAAERDRALVRASAGIPAGAIVVGNVAHLARHKGQIHLVRAFAELAPRVPDLHLVIAGEGEERPALEAAIRAGALGGRAHLVGFQEDVAAWLAAFDLFAMPSEQEGLGTSILDALASGLPVVGSRAGGIPEIIEDGVTGLLAPPGDSSALARAIAALLEDPARAARLAAAGRRLVAERFSAAAMVEGTIGVYRELLAPRPAPAASRGKRAAREGA